MKKTYIYGAGKIGKKVSKRLGREKVAGFIDAAPEKVGTYINGVKVYAIDDIVINSDMQIVVAVNEKLYQEAYNFLCQKGFEAVIYCAPQMNILPKAIVCADVVGKGKNWIGSEAIVQNCKMGYGSYIGEKSVFHNCYIGHYTAIGPQVELIVGQHPTHTIVSTHPSFYAPNHVIGFSYCKAQLFEEYRTAWKQYSVIIGNDCWIGAGVRIMEGVTIADGTIVAAGAIVVKDTEPYSIVAGVPAKVVKYRFDEEDIRFLLRLQWWHRGKKWIRKHAHLFMDIKMLRKELEEI